VYSLLVVLLINPASNHRISRVHSLRNVHPSNLLSNQQDILADNRYHIRQNNHPFNQDINRLRNLPNNQDFSLQINLL